MNDDAGRRTSGVHAREYVRDENCHQCGTFQGRIQLCDGCTRSEVA